MLNGGTGKDKMASGHGLQMKLIETDEDVAEGVQALAVMDPRLLPVIEKAGVIPLRRVPPGFASMVSIVVSQQISRASADAIMGRLNGLLDPITASAMRDAGDDLFRQAGLSRPKQRTLVALAQACHDGTLDLDEIARFAPPDAMARLTAVHGIGPWSAEIYLLFALGHPDIFPARDIALQVAVGHALGLPERPTAPALSAIGESWAPWRGVAARLFWAYYRTLRGREGAPAAPA